MKRTAALATTFFCICVAGCGGIVGTIKDPPPTPTIKAVTVSCAPVNLNPNQTSQCTAAVSGTGAFSSNVTWSAVSGSISSAGLYTAPSSAPTSGADTVKATSTQDATKSGTAAVTITAPAPTITSVSVSCVPTSVQTGKTSQCSATVSGTGAFSSSVTWSAVSGSISSAGLYTAPSSAPTSGADTIKATSTQDTTKSGTAAVTVTAPAPTITSVSVSCVPTSVQTGRTSQCSATVSGTGAFSSNVTWSAISGSISSAGLYTAPSSAPTSGADTVKATSTEDSTKSGTAALAITSPSATVTGIVVVASPASITTAQTSTCSATVSGTGAFSTAVTWSASGGSITSAGVFTPSGAGRASCTAKSTQSGYTNVSGAATITVSAVAPTITGVSLVCTASAITDVQTDVCTPSVTGTGSFANTVNLSLAPASAGTLSAASNVASGTAVTFTPSGTGAESLAITATSTADSTKFNTVPVSVTVPTAGPTCSGMSTGNQASLNGFVPFPSSNAWNTDISSAPLDPNNTAITSAAGFAGLHLHHDFSSVAGGNYGIPYVVVDSSATPSVSINVIDYASESDVAVAPYPITAPIEGSPADCDGWPDTYIGDSHVLVLDRNRCMLYETFNTHRCNGAWSSSSETIWDMKTYDKRPWGWTSADAAGLPIFSGLVRYDEVAAGAINHAIRFTMQQTKNDANGGYFVAPATHAAGTTYGVSNIIGMRIRLKASFDISSYSAANQVILTAMKKYGMILADNGSYFYFQGVPDPRWDDNDLVNLDSIQSSNFEVVQMTPAFPGYDDATAPTGNPPTINSFTSSASSVGAGTPITLTWTTTNDSYDFIDVLGGVDGGTVTTTPTATTTYTLNATNQYGRATAQVTVTVH